MIINRENITSTHLHAFDTNSLVYKHFSGKFGISEPHIFEFLETLESNFKIARLPLDMHANKIKTLLRGRAKDSVPDDLKDYNLIKETLISRFGDPVVILQNISDLHTSTVGQIESKCVPMPNWENIEFAAKQHLILIRKAEKINNHPRVGAYEQIFSSGYRNITLINCLPHEFAFDLRQLQNQTDPKTLYILIKERFQCIFQQSSKNADTTQFNEDFEDLSDNDSENDI